MTSLKTVTLDPRVAARLFLAQAKHPRNEVGGLLLGRARGERLEVARIVMTRRVGNAVHIQFTAADFERAHTMAERLDLLVVGWAHGHPTYGAFLSSTDIRHQSQSQEFYPDYVALVIDPFKRHGIDMKIFRVAEGRAVDVSYEYGVVKHEAQEASPHRRLAPSERPKAALRRRWLRRTRVASRR